MGKVQIISKNLLMNKMYDVEVSQHRVSIFVVCGVTGRNPDRGLKTSRWKAREQPIGFGYHGNLKMIPLTLEWPINGYGKSLIDYTWVTYRVP